MYQGKTWFGAGAAAGRLTKRSLQRRSRKRRRVFSHPRSAGSPVLAVWMRASGPHSCVKTGLVRSCISFGR